jgi:hypothetical protein
VSLLPPPDLHPEAQARLVLRVALALLDRLPAGEDRDRSRTRLAVRLAQLDAPSAQVAASFRHAFAFAQQAETVLVQAPGPPRLLRRLVQAFTGQVERAWPGSPEELFHLFQREIARAELLSLPRRLAADLVDFPLLLRAGEPRPTLWLLRRPDGGLVLLLRQHGRLERVEGSHEDVLASVPDEQFAAAVEAARG